MAPNFNGQTRLTWKWRPILTVTRNFSLYCIENILQLLESYLKVAVVLDGRIWTEINVLT